MFVVYVWCLQSEQGPAPSSLRTFLHRQYVLSYTHIYYTHLLWGIFAPTFKLGEQGRDSENTSDIEMSAYFPDIGMKYCNTVWTLCVTTRFLPRLDLLLLPVEVRCYISCLRCRARNTRCNAMSHLAADAGFSYRSRAKRHV